MNSVLPYCQDQPALQEQESAAYLQTIKENLTASILSADFVRGAFFWSKQLENYLDLKFQLLKSDRLWFANLFYQLMCNRSVPLDPNADQSASLAESMDWSLIEHWCLMCWRMIEPYELFCNTDLEFEWRPLYFLLKEVYLPRQRQKVFPRQIRHMDTVVKFLPILKRFFVASNGCGMSLVEELCDEFLSKINLELASHAFPACLAWFTAFAPVTLKTQHHITESIVDLALPKNSSQFKIHQELEWTNLIFDLWGCIVPSQTVDSCFMEILADLCSNQYGQNTFYLNESQLRFVLSNAHRVLRLPIGSGISMGEGGAVSVGSKKVLSAGNPVTGMKIASIDNICMKSSIMKRRDDYLKAVAKIIVYNIFPKSFYDHKYHPHLPSDILLPFLETWFHSLESFFHPSNHGQWSKVLADLLHNISQQLLNRIIWEGLGNDDVKFTDQSFISRRYSPVFNIDVPSRQRLVKMMRPLLLMSMFSKDAQARSYSQLAISYLMKHDPQLLFSKLLEEIDPSLTTLTETHRTSAAISLLGEIVVPMIHRIDYPEGARHLVNVMYNILPGLDVNDPVKTNVSYSFITKVLVHVPLNDLSALEDVQLSDSEKQLCNSTSLFEEWTHSFLDKTFELLEKVPHMRENTQEANVFRHAMFSCNILANQLSLPGCERIRDSVLDRIFRLMTDRVMHQAFGTIFNIVYNFCSAFPEQMFTYLPILKNRIFEEIESGAAADPYKGFKEKAHQLGNADIYGTDASLIWYLKCVYGYSQCIGALSHDQDLFQTNLKLLLDIADLVWTKCETRYAYTLATKMYRGIFASMGDIWLKEFRSIPKSYRVAEEINFWGVTMSERLKINNLNQDLLWKSIEPSWHIPNNNEKMLLFQKLTQIADSEIRTLENHLKVEKLGDGIVGSAKLCKSLTLLCRILDSVAPLVQPHDPDEILGDDAIIEEVDDDVIDDDMAYDDDDEDEEVEYENDTSGLQRIPVRAYYCFSHNSAEFERLMKLKENIGKLLIRVVEYVNSTREDDMDVLQMTLKAIHIFINNRGIEKQKYAELNNGYAVIKSMFMTQVNSVVPRQYPRFVLLYRLRLQDKKRKYHNAFLPIRNAEQDIALSLLSSCQAWAVSQFAEIRAVSQSVLFKCLRFFKSFKYDLVQNVLNLLMEFSTRILEVKKVRDLAESELIMSRIKGCLYLLGNASIHNVCLRTPKYVSQFMLCLCNVAQVDKPSIQKQLTQVFVGFLGRFVESPFTTAPSRRVLSLLGRRDVDGVYAALKSAQIKKSQEKREQILKTRREVIKYIAEDSEPHWHVKFLGLHFCELLHRLDTPLTYEAVNFILNCLNDDVLSIRNNSLGVILRIMYILKQRSAAADASLKYSKFITHTDYRDEMRTLSTNNTLISDKPEIGWQFCSKYTKVYSTDGVKVGCFMSDPTSSDVAQLLETFFSSTDFWTKFFELVAQESAISKNSSTAEEFLSVITIKFYKSIFQLFHDKFLYSVVDPIIAKWFTAYTDKALQRAALEFIMGLIRGMKHWTGPEREKCWGWLLPKMKGMMINATPDMSSNWNSGFFWMVQNRHPVRFLPLIQMILSDKEFEIDFDSDAAFNESKKLNYVRLILRNFGSRVADLVPKVLHTVLHRNCLASRYQIIRNAVGSLVWELICAGSAPKESVSSLSYLKDVSTAVESTSTCGKWYSVGSQGEQILSDIFLQLEKLYESTSSSKVYGSEYSNLAKTVTKIISDGLGCGRPYLLTRSLFEPLSSKQKYSMLIHLLLMQATDDKDLSESTYNMAAFVPDLHVAYRQRELFPALMLDALHEIACIQTKIDEEKGRRNKLRALALLQVLFFRNLAEMTIPKLLEKSLEIIVKLLQDVSVEIRQLASITLSGIIRTCPTKVTAELQVKFMLWLQIPLRRASDTGDQKSMPVIPENIAKRHGAVLGISSLVYAYPYTIPKWVPDLLLAVSNHRSDPSPIAASVQYLFNEFRRTHQDTWSEVVGKTDYLDFYQFSVVGKKHARTSEEESGVFTQKHLDALEGLLTNAAQYFY